ncbi:hypothetical protein HHI36_015693 [Cryptolaemus montrouzieri]|uniref:Cytochrome c oxidase subunit VIa n=1 Tax=Cryptolaemus montrouzieri TaxID=559131 RepID=A0ABD2N6C5_9CUCU
MITKHLTLLKNFNLCKFNLYPKWTIFDANIFLGSLRQRHSGQTYPPQPSSGHYKPYKYTFLGVAIPAIIALSLFNYREYEHQKKCYRRPPFVKYPYLYRRTKRFPWGDGNKSFFHNKEKNALPDGYED